jgi:hypothetical protein
VLPPVWAIIGLGTIIGVALIIIAVIIERVTR